jgi:BON domain
MHMAEPFFGSGAPLWAAPGPAFGFTQTPLTSGARLGSPGMQASAPYGGGMLTGVPTPNPDPYTMAAGSMIGNQSPSFSAGLSAAIMPGAIGNFPSFTGSEIAIGVTAPALLAAVAMRRGQPLGPTNDQEIEDFIYDALDLLPGANDVEVRIEGGRAIVTGSVPHKRLKRDVGEIAWAIPSVHDVQNNINIAARRRGRSQGRGENEPSSVAAARKA